MTPKDFGIRVAGVSGQTNAIADLIALILPILLSLPCFKTTTAEEKQEWIDDHPVISRNAIIRELRRRDDSLTRKGAGEVADRMLEESSRLTAAEFSAGCHSMGV